MLSLGNESYLMLVHGLGCWPNIKYTLGKTLVAGKLRSRETLSQCWFKVGPPSQTVGQL